MKAAKRLGLLFVIAGMLLGLSACGASGRYKNIKTLEDQKFYIGYRQNDAAGYFINCAVAVLAAEGTVSQISRTWFGDERLKFGEDAAAIENAGYIAPRELIIGVDENAFPASYLENGEYKGFDVELAKAACEKLGWEPKFISILPENAYVELSSGNVDIAWGGMNLDEEAKNYSVIGPYMENSVIIAARSDVGGSLGGKTLYVDTTQSSMAVLDANAAVRDKLGKITRVNINAVSGFQSLDIGDCDALLTDSMALDYYNRF